MKKLITMLSLTVTILLITGCSDEETFSRYPSVSVPEYQTDDYIRNLSDSNPEQVYNAVCNLGPQAGRFSKTLCADDADPASPKYQEAAEAYRAVCSLLDSDEPYTVAAGLRFLQIFGGNYKPKEELVDRAIQVESRHPQVQFEQATLLTALVNTNSQLPAPLLQRLLDSPSWIVSRTTYRLIGKLKNEPLRQELVRRFEAAENEEEQLLLITALQLHLEPKEARLIETLTLASESPGIRRTAARSLINNPDCPGVRPWFEVHYGQFSAEEKDWLYDACADPDLMCMFIAQGYMPADKELMELLKCLESEEDPEAQAYLHRFEEAILAAPQLAERWQALQRQVEQERRRQEALRTELAPRAEAFIAELEMLLAKHEMPAGEQKNALENISKALAPLTGED